MAIYSSSHKTVVRLAGSIAAIVALAGPALAQDTVTLRLGHLFQGANTSTELYKGIIDSNYPGLVSRRFEGVTV